jgi:hypothetical protein
MFGMKQNRSSSKTIRGIGPVLLAAFFSGLTPSCECLPQQESIVDRCPLTAMMISQSDVVVKARAISVVAYGGGDYLKATLEVAGEMIDVWVGGGGKEIDAVEFGRFIRLEGSDIIVGAHKTKGPLRVPDTAVVVSIGGKLCAGAADDLITLYERGLMIRQLYDWEPRAMAQEIGNWQRICESLHVGHVDHDHWMADTCIERASPRHVYAFRIE